MKRNNLILDSPLGRALVYLSIFIAGSALHELFVYLIHPTIWSNTSLALTLFTISAFTFVGALLAAERHAISRITSAATLFILSFIALRIGHSVVPDPYLLAVALGMALIGAQPLLHRKATNLKRVVLYGLLAGIAAIAIAVTFTYGMTVLNRIVMQQQQYESHE